MLSILDHSRSLHDDQILWDVGYGYGHGSFASCNKIGGLTPDGRGAGIVLRRSFLSFGLHWEFISVCFIHGPVIP